MENVKPSTVRTLALGEYNELSRTLDELDHLTAKLESEGESAVPEALACAAKLLKELSVYIDVEAMLVLPTVRNADIWGDLRADALAQHHEAQRDELRALELRPGTRVDAAELAGELAAFAHELRDSLERERREILGSDIMRDDVIGLEPD